MRDQYLLMMPFLSLRDYRFNYTSFVVQMDLMPKSESVEMTLLTPSGLVKKIERVSNIVPATWDDYRVEHTSPFYDRPAIIDRDMIYMSTADKEFYNFDSAGEWSEEGVNHEGLSLEKNYDEKKYYDSLRPLQK